MIRGNVLQINSMKCPFCEERGEASRCRRTGQHRDGSYDYECALGHDFARLPNAEYRLKAVTPRRIEENNGGLY